MEIKIERPFHLKLDVIEIDEHVPSMKVDVPVRVPQFGQSLEYRGYLWFECACWDTFVSDLSRIDETQAKLINMGGSFCSCSWHMCRKARCLVGDEQSSCRWRWIRSYSSMSLPCGP